MATYETERARLAAANVDVFRPTHPCRIGSTNPVVVEEVEMAFDPLVAIDWARARRDYATALARMVDATIRQVTTIVERYRPDYRLVRFVGSENQYGDLELDMIELYGVEADGTEHRGIAHRTQSAQDSGLEIAWRCLVGLLANAGIDAFAFDIDLELRRVLTSSGGEQSLSARGVVVEFMPDDGFSFDDEAAAS